MKIMQQLLGYIAIISLIIAFVAIVALFGWVFLAAMDIILLFIVYFLLLIILNNKKKIELNFKLSFFDIN